jgi:23S rRNA pseudouridine2605 synthase
VSERLQKFLARAGVASRRHAEGLITAGRVAVNNQVVTTLGTKVAPGDLVTVDGTLVSPPERSSWYLLHKPPGVVTTLADPEGRPTVAEFLAEVSGRVFPVGRLDWDAEGALLFTDDGGAAHRLLHPSFEVPRTYLVKVKGTPTDETLQRLVDGVRLEDGPARALRAARYDAAERNTWIELQLGEGRPHLVKRLCAAVGHPVLRLFRPAQASVSVAGLGSGQVRPLTAEEVRRVEGIAAGEPLPPVELFLPPRRHGRSGDDDAELHGTEEATAGQSATPGRTRAPRAGPPGGRGAKRGPGQVGTRFPRQRDTGPGPGRAGASPRRAGGHAGGRAEGSEHRPSDRRWSTPDAERTRPHDRSPRRPGSDMPRFGRGGGRGSRPPERAPSSGGPGAAGDVRGDWSEARPARAGRGPSAGRGSRPPRPRAFSSDRSGTPDDSRPRRTEPGAQRTGRAGDPAPRSGPPRGERWGGARRPPGGMDDRFAGGRQPHRGGDRSNAEADAGAGAGARWKRADRDSGPHWKGRKRDARGDGERGPPRGREFHDRRGPGEAPPGRFPPRPGGRPGAAGSGGRPARGRFGTPRSGPPRSFSPAPDARPRSPGGRPGGGPRRPPHGSNAPRTHGNRPGPRGGGAGGRGRGGGPRRH